MNLGARLRSLGPPLTVVAALAAIVGLAIALNRWWVILVGIGVVAVYGALRPIGRNLLEAGNRIRNYPGLLSRVAAGQDREANLEQRVTELEAQCRSDRSAGIVEGRERVVGAILSRRAGAVPELAAVTLAGESVILVGSIPKGVTVYIGTRFSLVIRGSGETKGHVQVREVIPSVTDDAVMMECVGDVVPEFWARLAERALADNAPPAGVVLTRYAAPGEVDVGFLLEEAPMGQESAPEAVGTSEVGVDGD